MSVTRHNLPPLERTALGAPLAAEPAHFLPKVEAGRISSLLLRRGWIAALAALLGAIALYFVASRLPKTYVAYGSVYVNSQAPAVLDIRAIAPEETRDLEQMRSVEQAMGNSTLLLRVIEANGLANAPDFAPPGTSRQALVAILSGRVSVELSRGTRIISVSVEDTDPERARRLVESLVGEYQKWTNERQEGIARQASEGLAREESRLREKMEATARALQEFREIHPIPGLEGGDAGSPVKDALAALGGQLTTATADRLRLESEAAAYRKFDPADPGALAGLAASERGTEVLSQVRAIQQKEADFGRIKERYMFKHPVFKEAANELALMKSNLAETVRAAGQSLEQRFAVAQENEAKLAAEVAQARTAAVEMEGMREKFRAMSRDADADRGLHDAVALRLRETSMTASVPASVLRWEAQPMTPEKPASPRKIVFAAVGGFAGFLAGVLLAAALEMGDRKIRDAGGAARAAGVPMLVTVPAMPDAGGMLLVTDPSSAGAEAFRRLRTVLAPPAESDSATVLFASAGRGEGKSLCALNYATALAMQGHRTLLLDADLRSPGLSRQHLGGADEDSGLGGYLAGKVEAAQACFATALPNLYLLSSGPLRADAAELLAGTRFPALLEDAFRWFDRVVIDTPAALPVTDALALARYAHRICMVVRDRGCDRRELRRAADTLRSAGGNLFGFVWNEDAAGNAGPRSKGPEVAVKRPALPAPSPADADNSGISPRLPNFA